ncbi:MAG: DUF192 domain-containing protein [Treponemataceae bacterium]
MIHKIRKNLFTTALIFLIFFNASCTEKSTMKQTTIKIERIADNSTLAIQVELAQTQAEHSQGFMHRKKIPEGMGMLFIFSKDDILSFWMKNTFVPLSIAYIDSRGTIRDIFDMKPLSEQGVPSSTSVRYALEVPQGWFKKNNISTGDKLILPIAK